MTHQRIPNLILLISLFLFVGCVPPYKPGKPTNPDTPIVNVSPSVAFDNYKRDTANNFRKLAQNCLDGTFEYVSELVDASVKLDKEAKIKRSKPIDTLIKNELGSDKLDKVKAVEILLKIADDLDPAGKITPKTTSIEKPVELKLVGEPLPIHGVYRSPKVCKVVARSTDEIIQQCRADVQPYGVIHTTFRDHLINEHHYTVEQVGQLPQRVCRMIHDNTHAGIVTPTKIIEE